MWLHGSVRAASTALATATVLVVVAALAGVAVPITAVPSPSVGVSLLAVQAALVLTVLIRPVLSREGTDAVLGVCALPCLLAAAYAGYERYALDAGVRWGDAAVLATGVLLAAAVVADAVARAVLRHRRPRPA